MLYNEIILDTVARHVSNVTGVITSAFAARNDALSRLFSQKLNQTDNAGIEIWENPQSSFIGRKHNYTRRRILPNHDWQISNPPKLPQIIKLKPILDQIFFFLFSLKSQLDNINLKAKINKKIFRYNLHLVIKLNIPWYKSCTIFSKILFWF